MHYFFFFFLTVEEYKKKERKKKGNLTRFEIVDIYDDIPSVCRKFITQIK